MFAGGWTMEAAEVVCPGEGIDEDDVLDLLSKLVEKSLVVAETPSSPGAGGALRYRMLEPVRQYGRERLDEGGETERVRDRHARTTLSWQKLRGRTWSVQRRPRGWRGWRRSMTTCERC